LDYFQKLHKKKSIDLPSYTPQNTIEELPKSLQQQSTTKNLSSHDDEFVSDNLDFNIAHLEKDSWEEELKAELGGIESGDNQIDESWEEQMKKELQDDLPQT